MANMLYNVNRFSYGYQQQQQHHPQQQFDDDGGGLYSSPPPRRRGGRAVASNWAPSSPSTMTMTIPNAFYNTYSPLQFPFSPIPNTSPTPSGGYSRAGTEPARVAVVDECVHFPISSSIYSTTSTAAGTATTYGNPRSAAGATRAAIGGQEGERAEAPRHNAYQRSTRREGLQASIIPLFLFWFGTMRLPTSFNALARPNASGPPPPPSATTTIRETSQQQRQQPQRRLNPAAVPFQPRGLAAASEQQQAQRNKPSRPRINTHNNITNHNNGWSPTPSPTLAMSPSLVNMLITQQINPVVSDIVTSQWRLQARHEMDYWLQRELLAEGLAEDGTPLPLPSSLPPRSSSSGGSNNRFRTKFSPRASHKRKTRFRRGGRIAPYAGYYPAIMEEDEEPEAERRIPPLKRIVFRNPWIPKKGEVIPRVQHVGPMEQPLDESQGGGAKRKGSMESCSEKIQGENSCSPEKKAMKMEVDSVQSAGSPCTSSPSSLYPPPAPVLLPSEDVFPMNVQETGLNGDGLTRYPTFPGRRPSAASFVAAGLDSRVPPTFPSPLAMRDGEVPTRDFRRNYSEPAVVGFTPTTTTTMLSVRARANSHAVDHLQTGISSDENKGSSSSISKFIPSFWSGGGAGGGRGAGEGFFRTFTRGRAASSPHIHLGAEPITEKLGSRKASTSTSTSMFTKGFTGLVSSWRTPTCWDTSDWESPLQSQMTPTPASVPAPGHATTKSSSSYAATLSPQSQASELHTPSCGDHDHDHDHEHEQYDGLNRRMSIPRIAHGHHHHRSGDETLSSPVAATDVVGGGASSPLFYRTSFKKRTQIPPQWTLKEPVPPPLARANNANPLTPARGPAPALAVATSPSPLGFVSMTKFRANLPIGGGEKMTATTTTRKRSTKAPVRK
ncbi:hypothetical protein FRC17_010206 [Serendipita sp. 399]|nr:hypothetical protein FRC17_010206 [Serendipita sp. 399]